MHLVCVCRGGTVIGTNNRLLEDVTYTYLYDDNGNRIRKTDKATGDYEEYAWDHRNRLVAVEFHNSAGTLTRVIEYRYDAFDRLIARYDNTDGVGAVEESEFYIHDSAPGKSGLDDIVLVYDENGNVIHRYLHGPAVDQIFSDESAVDGLLWALADRQGSVRDWVDYDEATDTTSVYNHVEYDSFGNIENQSNAAHEVTVGYTGRYLDPVTGLQWNRGRWYDASTGRWLSEDPIGFGGGDVNLGRYVGNSPTNFLDPSGLSAFVAALPIAGGSAVADGPIPIGDVIAGGILIGAAGYDLYNWLSSEPEPMAVDGAGQACPASDLTPTGARKTEPSTRKGNKGGTSIQEGYKDTQGRDVTKHMVCDPKGKIIHGPHYRPGGFK